MVECQLRSRLLLRRLLSCVVLRRLRSLVGFLRFRDGTISGTGFLLVDLGVGEGLAFGSGLVTSGVHVLLDLPTGRLDDLLVVGRFLLLGVDAVSLLLLSVENALGNVGLLRAGRFLGGFGRRFGRRLGLGLGCANGEIYVGGKRQSASMSV